MRAAGPDAPAARSRRRAEPLEALRIEGLPETAVPAFEAALQQACLSVAWFRDEATDTWCIEGIREAGAQEEALAAALALAAVAAGIALPEVQAAPVEAEGWLSRTVQAFPEMPIGRRFLIRPTHMPDRATYGRVVLKLDAGLAFGSGEHASTQGCLRALEGVLYRRPRRVCDLGSGSGILAIAAAKTMACRVIATDIEPWSVRVCEENARRNGLLRRRLRAVLADGWKPRLMKGARFDLVFANILARPLCAMARDLARHLSPRGTAILAGLVGSQARMVLAAHRRQGLILERRIDVGPWTTLVLRRRG